MMTHKSCIPEVPIMTLMRLLSSAAIAADMSLGRGNVTCKFQEHLKTCVFSLVPSLVNFHSLPGTCPVYVWEGCMHVYMFRCVHVNGESTYVYKSQGSVLVSTSPLIFSDIVFH